MSNPTEMSLASLGNGDLMACVEQELRKIGDNIADPNVKTSAKRKLTIVIEFKPDEKGQSAQIDYNVKSSLPAPMGGKTMAHIAMVPGSSAISFFEVAAHPPLFEKPHPNLVPLEAKEA